MTNPKAKLESVCLVPTALIHIKSDKKVKNKGLESCDSKCEEAGRPSGYLQGGWDKYPSSLIPD